MKTVIPEEREASETGLPSLKLSARSCVPNSSVQGVREQNTVSWAEQSSLGLWGPEAADSRGGRVPGRRELWKPAPCLLRAQMCRQSETLSRTCVHTRTCVTRLPLCEGGL